MSISTNKELSSNVIYYTVYLLSNDVITKGYDVLFTVRKNYFDVKKKKKDRVFLNVDGQSIKYNYLIDNNKPLKWVKENDGKVMQKVSANGSGSYILQTLDFSGAVIKKEYFTNNHIYEKSEYFDGFSQEPYKTIIPLITDKTATFALYLENSKKPITLKSVEMPNDNAILNDLILEVSPELAANTSEGFTYFCSEDKEKQWNDLLSNYKNNIKLEKQEKDIKTKEDRFIFNEENLSIDIENIKLNIKEIAQPLSKYKKDNDEKVLSSEKTEEIKEEIVKENKEQTIEKSEVKVEKISEETEEEIASTDFDMCIDNENDLEYISKKEKTPDKEIKENSKDKNLYYGKLDDNNNRIGYGRTTTSNGRTLYDGEYLNDMQSGFGVSYYKTGRLNYIGNWLENKKSGFGISIRPTDGCVQVGNYKNDKLEDISVKFDKFGKLMYIGNYKKDERKGFEITVNNSDIIVTKKEDKMVQNNATILNDNGDLLYTGGLKNNKKDGKGMLFSEDIELVYKGEFKNDEYNGNGALYLENGVTITGEFKSGKVCGKAVKRDNDNKVIYDGLFKDSLYNGSGRLYFENGMYKEGEFVKGNPTGDFTLYTKDNKRIYKGQLTDDIYDGKGVLYNEDEILYSGAFLNGEKYGLGREFEDGICIYMGEFESGLKNGFGTIYKNNKPHYIGYFKNGKKNGNGILYDEKGNKYVGQYKDDKMDGRINVGINNKVVLQCIYQDGQCIYIREYSQEGTLIFDGNIKNDLKEGMGISFNEYGDKIFEGIFKEDKPYKNMKVITKTFEEITSTDKLDATEYKQFLKVPSVAVEIPYKNSIYSGQVDSNNIPFGRGVMLCCDHKIIGEFNNGKAYGEANIVFDNGEEKNLFLEENKTDDTLSLKFTNVIYHYKK